MLPDYPQLKGKLWDHHMKLMEVAHGNHLGFFDGIKARIMHEGETNALERADGSISETIPELLRATSSVPAPSPNIEDIEPEDILKSIVEAGRKLADEKARMIVASIEQATKRAGTQIGPGENLAEQILKMIEKMWIDFDATGQPILGQRVVPNQDAVAKYHAAWDQIHSIPELQRRFQELIERKRGEFDEREAARNLVD